jgi:hypothetical protein
MENAKTVTTSVVVNASKEKVGMLSLPGSVKHTFSIQISRVLILRMAHRVTLAVNVNVIWTPKHLLRKRLSMRTY